MRQFFYYIKVLLIDLKRLKNMSFDFPNPKVQSIEKEIDSSIFEDMGLDFYEVKETFKELETEVHSKMNEKGLINNKNKSERAELIAENTILEAATASISVSPDEIKQKENKDKEIDSLINDILGENIEDI